MDPKLSEAMCKALDRLRIAMTEWHEATLPALNETIRAEFARMRAAADDIKQREQQ